MSTCHVLAVYRNYLLAEKSEKRIKEGEEDGTLNKNVICAIFKSMYIDPNTRNGMDIRT